MDMIAIIVKMGLLAFFVFKIPSLIKFLRKFRVFLPLVLADAKERARLRKLGQLPFGYYGVRMFCGRQGAGKTTGLVWYLEKIRRDYPNCEIYTNFDYAHQTGSITSLNDLLVYRNGMDGVVFALDEIQNEFSSAASKDFPETLLSTLTMQRKQRICILTTSQVFSRVAKPIREQCFQVVECRTIAGRWTRLKAFDAVDYNKVVDDPDPAKRVKLPKVWKDSFVQTDALRKLFDTYAVVERLSRQGFARRIS